MKTSKITNAVLSGFALLWHPLLLAQSTNDARPPEEIRLEKFREDLKTAADPVALAIPAAKDRSGYVAIPALDVLLEHWKDPRSEQTLDEVAQGGPHWRGELGLTVWGEAAARLGKVRAKKQIHALLGEKATAKEKLEAIREWCRAHPEVIDPNKGSHLKTMVIEAAMEYGGGEAMDLVAPSSALPAGGIVAYVKKYPKEAIAFARQQGPICFSYWGFGDGFIFLGPDAVSLVEEWLKNDPKGENSGGYIYALSRLPDGKQRMLNLLNDPRPAVVKRAAGWLRSSFPDQESQEAIRAALERRRQAGAPEDELSYYAAVLGQIGASVAEKKGRP